MKNTLIKTKNIIFTFTACILFSALISCNQNSKSPETPEIKDSLITSTAEDTVMVPEKTDSIDVSGDSLIKLKEATGDLDKDGIEEKVIVYDTKVRTDMGTERQMHIFKTENGNWKVWHKNIGAVLASENGGMMGDPFESIAIDNGCIVVSHYGGARDRWGYTHRYRFQNEDWFLIGATIWSGTMCEGSSNYDYNLSTGKIEVTITTEACDEVNPDKNKQTEEKSSFVSKPAKPIRMDGISPGSTKVEAKGKRAEFYY